MNDQELDKLPSMARAALVAASAEHVLDFYRLGNFSLQLRHAPGKALVGAPDEDLLERAIKIAWEVAEGGKPDKKVLDAVLAGLSADPSDASPDDMCMPGLTTLGMVGDVIRSLRDKTPKHASGALRGGASAVVDGTGAVVGEAEAKRYAKQETAWQREVFERAKKIGDAATSRAGFRDLIEKELPWRQHLPAYREYYNG